MTSRRHFLGVSGAAMTIAGLPDLHHKILTAVPRDDKKSLADAALNAARSAGASYSDVRIGRYLNQSLFSRETQIQGVSSTESYGAGIRVIVDGTWGFAATHDVSKDGVVAAARQAAAIAKANAILQTEPVRLAPQNGYGEVEWATPVEVNAFDIPLAEKAELLLDVGGAAMAAGASFFNASLFLRNEQKYFASSDGSYIDQDIHRIWPTFSATAVDPDGGKFASRSALSQPVGMGWEYLAGRPSGMVETPVGTMYGWSYDMAADAEQAAHDAKANLTAKSVEPGRYDLILDPSHLWLTIHESVGHPLELDRVLGYEANYAGTSFATLDKWQSGDFKYGSPLVTLYADKLEQNSLGSVGYDDEGVGTREWDLVKDGVLVNYQATRDQVHILGQNQSHGCSYADSWSSVQFQRMPNVSLRPGSGPATPADLVADVEKGIYIVGDGSYSIDQQRYNFQFGGQIFYEIEDGEIKGRLRDVAYQSNTQEFWNSASAMADRRDWRMGGSFFDGKGQPGQTSSVSHGSSTTRFDDVAVINTGRSIG
jgi:TldD protein